MKCFEITMFSWWFGWRRYGTQKWKKKFCFIFLKTVTDDFNRWLIVTHVVNKLCTESSVHTKEWVYL